MSMEDSATGSRSFERPNIFIYTDYRVFLADFFNFRKRTQHGYSYRRFSTDGGFKSPNFLKLVTDGKRNLTIASIRAVAGAFRLTPDETTFFKNLVFFNQAGNGAEREKFAREIFRSKTFRTLYPLKEAELNYYARWYYIPIREMVESKDFREDAAWIVSRLHGKITEQEATQALEELRAIGAIARNEHGRLYLTQRNVTTGHEVQSAAVASFHKKIIEMAAVSIDETPRAEREISGSTVLLSESAFRRFKEMIQGFRQSLLAEADSQGESGDHTRVYQINFQLFPLTAALDGQPVTDEGEEKCGKAS